MAAPAELSLRSQAAFKSRQVAAEIHNYNPRAHDGGVALLLPNTKTIVALGAERVTGNKHSPDSMAAYDNLRTRYESQGYEFGGPQDRVERTFDRYQPIHHHMSHAASAYYPSGFDNAGVLVMDDRGYYGEGYNSTTIWKGEGKTLTPVEMNTETGFPTQSIGHLYSGFSDYLGFGFLEAGKTMGLAAYGKNSEIRTWLGSHVHSNTDGSYEIAPELSQAMRLLYGEHDKDKGVVPERGVKRMMDEVYSVMGPKRAKDEPLTERHADAAWAVQDVLEDLVVGLAKRTRDLTGSGNLTLAGGVALNSVANGKLARSGLVENLFVQPASGDDGQAYGKLLYRMHNEYDMDRLPDMKSAYMGPAYEDAEVEDTLQRHSDSITVQRMDESDIVVFTADAIANQQVIAWFQGGSEIGPRALGHRSILADPRPDWMRDHINFDVKNREWFRPLAPSVPLEDAPAYFDTQVENPYMLVVADVLPDQRSVIPAVTHVDGTARLQTVREEDNLLYHQVIKEFGRQTKVPVVLNTSFNVAGKPIVETPEDAVEAFLGTNLDALVMHDRVITKKT